MNGFVNHYSGRVGRVEDLLRGDNYRLEGSAFCEDIARWYRHQGGGQDNADQIIVHYNKDMKKKSEALQYCMYYEQYID